MDRSLALLRTGYPFLAQLRRSAPATELRLLGRRTTVVAGPEGARAFYDEAVMRRRGAIPWPLRRVLFGAGAVHGLDGPDHRHRKAMFVDLLTPAAAKAVAELADARWQASAGRPVQPGAVFAEAVAVHAAAAAEWAGVPATEPYPRLAGDLIAMVDGFGSLGRRYLRGARARRRAERWAAALVAGVRSGRWSVPGTALEAVAVYRGRDGRPLSDRVAGVELLNILRPTVAVAYFVGFAADALAGDPALRDRLAGGGEDVLEAFAHEVRRHYPFVPMLAARAKASAEVGGCPVRTGRRVLLDVYGTLHDPALWADPERFDLDRFLGVEPDPFTYFPQGGGDPATGHRCPGERIAVELIKTAARHLVGDRPSASRSGGYSLRRMPSPPR
jgi:fatty-acid peroxygenase